MLQAPHSWFIVAQVMSFGEWLCIIARSELGSDLDCYELSVQYWQLRGMFTSVRCVQLLLPNLFSRDQVQGHQRSADQGHPVL